MAEVPVYTLLAFNKGDDDGPEIRRKVPLWRLEDEVRHCAYRGFDTILFELDRETAAYTVGAPTGVVHVGEISG